MPKPAPSSPRRWSAAVALAALGLGASCGDRASGGGSTPADAAARPAAASPAEPAAAEVSAPAEDAAPGAPAQAKAANEETSPKRQDRAEPRLAAVAGGDEPRGDRFADLEVLCAALNKDYVDGTLTDYYGALKGKMRTAFGDDLRGRGEASMEPGRILEAARKTLGEAAGDPATPACDKLFDELDDLE